MPTSVLQKLDRLTIYTSEKLINKFTLANECGTDGNEYNKKCIGPHFIGYLIK